MKTTFAGIGAEMIELIPWPARVGILIFPLAAILPDRAKDYLAARARWLWSRLPKLGRRVVPLVLCLASCIPFSIAELVIDGATTEKPKPRPPAEDKSNDGNSIPDAHAHCSRHEVCRGGGGQLCCALCGRPCGCFSSECKP